MLTFFAIVSFLVFQLGQCVLFFYLMDARRHRRLLNNKLFSF
jgi:hypothetical protein